MPELVSNGLPFCPTDLPFLAASIPHHLLQRLALFSMEYINHACCSFAFSAASIPVIGFNAVLMSEHFGAFLAFVVLHAAMLVRYVRAMLPPRALRVVLASLLTLTGAVLAAGLAAVAGYVLNSPTYGWTGRRLAAFPVFACWVPRPHTCDWQCWNESVEA
eukprot:1138657-Pelagomonas_calceolata.AAC.1